MDRWAVEGRFFNNGRCVSNVRKAEEGEENCCRETRSCDIYIDIFDTLEEAREFAAGYKKA